MDKELIKLTDPLETIGRLYRGLLEENKALKAENVRLKTKYEGFISNQAPAKQDFKSKVTPCCIECYNSHGPCMESYSACECHKEQK